MPAERITAPEAYDTLTGDPDAVLVDVRTPAEWTYVGIPDLHEIGKRVIRVPWQDETGTPNHGFLDDLDRAGVDREQTVMFLCRSGGRSQAAADAALDAGFTRPLNVADGFEGPLDDEGHRGTVEGWKVAGLPWRQG